MKDELSVKQKGKAGRSGMILLGLSLLLFILFLFSFVFGRYDIPVGEVVKILFCGRLPVEKTWTPQMEAAVVSIRLPRILMACLVGCCLSSAGTAYQCVFRNPMASPDMLGATAGAGFGAALAILKGMSGAAITIMAFLFSLLTVGLVFLLGSRSRGERVISLLLAGMMVSSLFSAMTSYIKLVADHSSQLPAITYWLMGSLSGTRMSTVVRSLLPMGMGLVPLYLLRWRMNLLVLGEEEAEALGVRTGALRLAVILSATVITAASVAASGVIGWVGLVIPHICRRMMGNDCRYLIPASMLFGASFLLMIDNIARCAAASEIPIGILTAVIGAPFFIYLMNGRESIL